MTNFNPRKQIAHIWHVADVWGREGWRRGECVASAMGVLKHVERTVDCEHGITWTHVDAAIELFNEGEIKPHYSQIAGSIVQAVKEVCPKVKCFDKGEYIEVVLESLTNNKREILTHRLRQLDGNCGISVDFSRDGFVAVRYSDMIAEFDALATAINVEALTFEEMKEFREFVNSVACWDYLYSETARKVLELVEKFNPIIEAGKTSLQDGEVTQ